MTKSIQWAYTHLQRAEKAPNKAIAIKHIALSKKYIAEAETELEK